MADTIAATAIIAVYSIKTSRVLTPLKLVCYLKKNYETAVTTAATASVVVNFFK